MKANNQIARFYESKIENLNLENERNKALVSSIFSKLTEKNDTLLTALKDSQYYLETAINATPTGAIRNILTEANIRAMEVIKKANK